MSEQKSETVNRPDRDIVETMRDYNQTTTMYYPWVEVAADEIERLRAKLADMTAIVELMWDKYEDGDPMYSSEDWEVEDALRTYIGQCVNFSEEEHQRILSSIPENRAVARAEPTAKKTCKQCGKFLDSRGRCRIPEHNS